MEPVTQNYIDVRTTRGGEGKPFIAGTRISVQDIYVWHELRGSTPDEIVANYPHLSLAQVHAALTYFYEHADAIRDQLRREKEINDLDDRYHIYRASADSLESKITRA